MTRRRRSKVAEKLVHGAGVQAKLANVARNALPDVFPVTYIFMGLQTSSGAPQSHEYDIEILEDSEMELLWGYIQPVSATENGFVTIQDALDSGDLIGTLMGFNSILTGVRAVFPDRFTYGAAAQAQIGYGGTRIIIPGEMFLHAEVSAVNDGQASRCVVVGRIRGEKPIARMTGATGAVTRIHDRLF